MGIIVFYRKSDGLVLSYVSYNERKYNKEGKDIGLVRPSLEKCAENHGLLESDIGVKEFTKENPQKEFTEENSVKEDFKDNINDLEETDIKEI